MVDAPIEESPIDDTTVVRAISVFGARSRGITVSADSPELATELQRRWDAEGHAPPATSAPGSARGRLLHLARTIAARLPERWQGRLRDAVRRRRGGRRRS